MQGASNAHAAAVRQKKEKTDWGKKLRNFRENTPYLLMILPAILVVFLFNYLPIYGVLIAFQDFMPGDPILSRDTIWVGFQNFTRFFNDVQFWPLMKNTFLLCIIGFVIGFPLPILVSLALNALKHKKAGKVFQTIYTAPHFISLVVLVGMLQLFFGRYGLVNNLAASLGGERVSYFLESRPLWSGEQPGCQPGRRTRFLFPGKFRLPAYVHLVQQLAGFWLERGHLHCSPFECRPGAA